MARLSLVEGARTGLLNNELLARADRACIDAQRLLARRVKIMDKTVAVLQRSIDRHEVTLGLLRHSLEKLEKARGQAELAQKRSNDALQSSPSRVPKKDDDARGTDDSS
jgi:hypothetical protein